MERPLYINWLVNEDGVTFEDGVALKSAISFPMKVMKQSLMTGHSISENIMLRMMS